MGAERQGGEPALTVEWAARGDIVAVLERLCASLVLSTMPGLVIMLGAADGALTVSATPVVQPIGLAAANGRIAVASARMITVFADVPRLAPHHPERPGYYDAFFVPRTIHFTGECSMHDMVFAGSALIGANTKYSCVCRVDGEFSFTPVWRPSFITELKPEDRCHLNGFAAEDGQLRYVTALARTDCEEGWRALPDTSGLLIDAATNTVLSDGLCMPHSPRLVGKTLYLLNGGEGELLRVDRRTGTIEIVTRVPGFAHGLCHQSGVLFVGMSQNRASRRSNPPPIATRLPSLTSGVAAVDEQTGRILGAIEFRAGVSEIYDLRILPGIRRAGMQNVLAADGLIGVETPVMALWSKRRNDDLSHLAHVRSTDAYRIGAKPVLK